LLATEQINVAAQKQLPEVMQIHFSLSREFRVLSCFETLADAAESGSQVFKKVFERVGVHFYLHFSVRKQQRLPSDF